MRARVFGVIAIFSSPTGEVLATSADFATDRPDGCSLEESQKWRAREAVKRKAIAALCHPDIEKAITDYEIGFIANGLTRIGYVLSFVSIDQSGETSTVHA